MIPGFSVTIKRNGVLREKTQTANSPTGELTVLFCNRSRLPKAADGQGTARWKKAAVPVCICDFW